jgi:hypothetical protein
MTKTRIEKICEETGKVIHSKGTTAKAHLRSLQEMNSYPGYIYPCIHCKGYHVGRSKNKAHKSKY